MKFRGQGKILVQSHDPSRLDGEKAGDNPWDGWSLEWATSSPPPHNSFTEIPTLKVAEEEAHE